MKVIITGATGMVGKGVLLECLDHNEITEVLSISRRKLGMEHPKLKELLHTDFSEFASVKNQLTNYDACYACMGVTSLGLSELQYTNLTFDITTTLANELYKLNPEMTFIYVSGEGTDSTENGKVMWARVKGKTENYLLNIKFKQVYMFRPGAIIPKRGVQPSSKPYRILIKYLTWLLFLIKFVAPSKIVDSSQIGLAMIQATKNGYDKKIVNPVDIHTLSK